MQRIAMGLALMLAVMSGRSAMAGETTDIRLLAPATVIRAGLEEVTAAARTPAKAETQRSLIKAALLRWFDVQDMARRALSGHWAERSPSERAQFVEAVGDLFAGLLVDHLQHDYQVRYLSEQVAASSAVVKTEFVSQRGRPIAIAFTLRRAGSRWIPYDIVIEGVSVASSFRAQFERILRDQSYEALLEQMRLKAGRLEPRG